MTRYAVQLTAFCLVCLSSSAAFAQRGDRGDDDSGGRGGFGRGGDMGGGFGGPGGGFGGPGGGFGGPPGGGFGGPGGSWGGRGGDSGGGFGGRGGFDPSSFLDRLDANQNGMLDPDEMQGPAQFIVSRIQRDDPSIRTDRPIPISKIKEAFERSRSGRSDDRDRGREEEARRESDERIAEGMTAALLVPDFTPPVDALPTDPILGFGPAAELMAVAVTDQDQREAEELLRRYDRNNDKAISGDEISSRFIGNPLDFDRNGDKKLTVNELAVRAAKLRSVQNSPQVQQARSGGSDDRRGNSSRSRSGDEENSDSDPNQSRRSYLTNAPKLPEGLPGWYASKDTNGDQQIEMFEYSSDWTNELVAEFQKFDTDGDGVITPQECLVAVRNGASASGAMATTSSSYSRPSSATGVSSGAASGMSGSAGASPAGSTAGTSSAVTPEALQNVDTSSKNYVYVVRMMTNYDSNKDGALTADEWGKMMINPSAADVNGDGRVTAVEYTAWLDSRSK